MREHFLSTFYKYLLHIQRKQALIHIRQVHIILDALDKTGDYLTCLIVNDSMDIWEKFAWPCLKEKVLTGNTIKVYLRSLEYFAGFISKNLFYNKTLLPDMQKKAIIVLLTWLPDYQSTIHRRTAQTTMRKVDESFNKITPMDIQKLEASKLTQKAIKLIGLAAEHHPLSRTGFTCMRDNLVVTTMYENGSRPAPLQNA